MKLLSIIVPLYNSEKYLPKCLDSLLAQDISQDDYEIILVDDGSPDNSRLVAEEYASHCSNMIVLSQPNKGTSGARNTGLRQAVGKYVYFVDPDDYILENSLAYPLDKMETEELDILRFAYTEVDENDHPTKSSKWPETPDYSPLIMDGPTFMAQRLGVACYVWTFFFKSSLIKDNGVFFMEGDYYDDTPWLPRICSLAKRVDSIDVKRHFYLIRSDSLVQSKDSGSIQKKMKGQLFLLDELIRQNNANINESVKKWYGMMISLCVVSHLSLICKYAYTEKKEYINRLKEKEVFPLSLYRAPYSTKRKAIIINLLGPEGYCVLMKLAGR